jgi:5'-AMP-activated protein kinase, regulatory gamma subunit
MSQVSARLTQLQNELTEFENKLKLEISKRCQEQSKELANEQSKQGKEGVQPKRPRALTSLARNNLIQNPPSTLRAILNTFCLQEHALQAWRSKRPILIGDFQTIERALSRINAHSIRSLPVVDKYKIVIGVIDIIDIVAYVAGFLEDMGDSHALGLQQTRLRVQLMAKSVGSLLVQQKNKPYVASNQISLFSAVEYMVRFEQERFMIIDRVIEGNVAVFSRPEEFLDGLVTQADVLRFLAQNMPLLRKEPLFQKTLAELKLVNRTPLIVSHREITSVAFIEMMDKKRDSAAVVDDSGKLIANISASDLKGLTRNNCMLLSQTLDVFLYRDWRRGWWSKPLTIEVNDPLFFAVMQFAAAGVHRLYIIDNDGKPHAEVNHMDILKVLLQIQ